MFKKNRKSGFTLLELLIVVIIIGILAALALPRFTKMTKRAKTSEAAQAINALGTAEILYYNEHNDKFSGVMADLMVDINTTNFTYALTPNVAGDACKIEAKGTDASVGTGITVTGTVKNDGSRTALVYVGL